jgi:hypothetical protein
MSGTTVNVETFLGPITQFYTDWRYVQAEILSLDTTITAQMQAKASSIMGRWGLSRDLDVGYYVSTSPKRYQTEMLAIREGLATVNDEMISPIIDWIFQCTSALDFTGVLNAGIDTLIARSIAVGGNLQTTTQNTVSTVIAQWKETFLRWNSNRRLDVYDGIRRPAIVNFLEALDPDRIISGVILSGRKLEPADRDDLVDIVTLPAAGTAAYRTAIQDGFGIMPAAAGAGAVELYQAVDLDGVYYNYYLTNVANAGTGYAIFEADPIGATHYDVTVQITFPGVENVSTGNTFTGWPAGSRTCNSDLNTALCFIYSEASTGEVIDYGFPQNNGLDDQLRTYTMVISHDTRNALKVWYEHALPAAYTHFEMQVRIIRALPSTGSGFGDFDGASRLIDYVGLAVGTDIGKVLPMETVEAGLSEITSYVKQLEPQLPFVPLAQVQAAVTNAMGSSADFTDVLTDAFSVSFWFQNTLAAAAVASRAAMIAAGAVQLDRVQFKAAYRNWYAVLKFLVYLAQVDIRFGSD